MNRITEGRGRDVRHRTTRAPSPRFSRQASVGREVVAHDVADFESRGPRLNRLGQALGQFAARGFQSMSEVVYAGEKARIEEENRVQSIKGVNDAFGRGGADSALSDDLDYMAAFRTVRSERTAHEARPAFLEDWEAEKKRNPEADLAAFRQSWMERELMGFEDEEMQALVLSSFASLTDAMLPAFKQAQFMRRDEANRAMMESNVADAIGEGRFTKVDLQNAIARLKVISPMDPEAAPATVVSAMVEGVRRNPDMLFPILQLLETDGTGINGESFAKSFGDAYGVLERQLVEDWNGINSAVELRMARELENELANLPQLDADAFADYSERVLDFHRTHGAVAVFDKLWDGLAKESERRADVAAAVHAYDLMMTGDINFDPDFVEDNFESWFRSAYPGVGSVLDLDQDTISSVMLELRGVAPPGLREMLSSALLLQTDPEKRHKAFEAVNGVVNARNRDYAHRFLTDEGARVYDAVQRYVGPGGLMSADQAFQQVFENRKTADYGVDLKDLVTRPGSPFDDVAEFRDHVQRTLRERDWWTWALQAITWKDNDLTVDGQVLRVVEDYAALAMMEAGEAGLDPEKAVESAVDRVRIRTEMVPTPNGGMRLELMDPVTPIRRDRALEHVPFTTSGLNPYTEQVESTVDTFYRDAQVFLDTRLGEQFGLSHPRDLGLTRRYDVGGFTVHVGPDPVTLAPGDRLEVDGEIVEVPQDPKTFDAWSDGITPPHFDWVETEDDVADGVVYVLRYVPRWTKPEATYEPGWAPNIGVIHHDVHAPPGP